MMQILLFLPLLYILKNQNKFFMNIKNKIYLSIFLFFFVTILILLFFFDKKIFEVFVINQLIAMETIVSSNFYLSLFIFFLIYLIVILSNLPVAFLLSLASGYFYGNIYGSLLIIFSATISSVLLIIMYQKFLFQLLNQKVNTNSLLNKIKKEINDNSLKSLLFIRFSGIPFSLQNLLIASLNFKLESIFIVTVIGVTPMAIIFNTLGTGINQINNILIFENHNETSFLSLLIVVPVISLTLYGYRKMKLYIESQRKI